MSFKRLVGLKLKSNCKNFLQTPHPLGLNVISFTRLPYFDVFVFSLSDIRTCSKGYHGIRKNGNWKCKNRRVLSLLIQISISNNQNII